MGELATRIRAKYPGAYDSIDDATLESKVVAKYPGVYDHLVTPSNNPADYPQGKSVSEAERMRREFLKNEGTIGTRLENTPLVEQAKNYALDFPRFVAEGATMTANAGLRGLKSVASTVQGGGEAIRTGDIDAGLRKYAQKQAEFQPMSSPLEPSMAGEVLSTGINAGVKGLSNLTGRPDIVEPVAQGAMDIAALAGVGRAAKGIKLSDIARPATEVGKSIAEATRPAPTELQRLSREHNVPLPFGEEVNSPTAKFVEAKLERLPVIGIRGAMKKGGESLATAAKNIADEFATASEDPATTLVDRYKSNLKKGKDLASEAYGKISDALAENGDPGAIDPKATRGQLQSLLAKSPDIFDRLPGSQNEIKSIMNKILDSTTAKNTNTISSDGTKLSVSPPVIDPITRQPIASTVNLGTVEGMAGEGGISAGRSGKVTIPETDVIYGGRTKPIKLTYDDYTALRTKLGEYIDRAASSAGALGSNELRQLTIIKKALDQDFYNWGKNSGYENVTAAVDNARKVYKENVAPFENVPILKQIINDKFTPEQLLDAIAKPGHATLATRAMKGLAERDKALVQDAIMRRALAIGTEGAKEGTPISGAKYATFFEKMDTKTKNAAQSPMDVFFSPQQKQRVMGFAKLARAAERYGQYSANPLTGIQGADFAIPSAIGATAGVVGAPAAIASAAFTKAMSLMLTTETGKAILHRAYRLPDGASAAWQSILQQTSKYLKDERGLVGRDINDFLKDENGQPLTVYHGTKSDVAINEFDPSKIGTANDSGFFGEGYYFSKNPNTANLYAGDSNIKNGSVYPSHVKIKKPLNISIGNDKLPNDVIDTINEIRNKKHIDEQSARQPDIFDKLFGVQTYSYTPIPYGARHGDVMIGGVTSKELKQALVKNGYDGVVYNNGQEIVVFDPSQIVSKFK